MKKIIFLTAFLFTFICYSQDKIPFINLDDISTQISKLEGEENYSKIVELLNTVSENDSTYCDILVTKSYYLLNTDKYDEAITVTNLGLKRDCYDTHQSFYINKGVALLNKESYEEALITYDEGLKLFPNNHTLWYNKGVVLEKLERLNEAIEAHQKSITLNPTYANPHLRLGNICYNQQLMSQALMCYNIYLLLNYDTSSAFNTLNSLNNIVANKNENEADTDLSISEDDELFEDIDLVLNNKLALNSNYETGNKINIYLTRQNHALITQLSELEAGEGFWSTKYLPIYKWISETNRFNDFTYALSTSIKNENMLKS